MGAVNCPGQAEIKYLSNSLWATFINSPILTASPCCKAAAASCVI